MKGTGRQVIYGQGLTDGVQHFLISNSITVEGGTLAIGRGTGSGWHRPNVSLGGGISVSGGTFEWAGTSLTVGTDITLSGGNMTIVNTDGATCTIDVTGNVSISNASSTLTVAGGTMNIGGHLNAGSGSLTLGAGGKLVLQSGTNTENTLGTLTLSGDATLSFELVNGSFTGLGLSNINFDGHILTIDLGPELAQYLAQHDGAATLDLFDSSVANALQQAKTDGHLVLSETYGYTWEVNENGQLVFTAPTETLVWSEENHSGNLTLIWESGQTDGRWDNSADFTPWRKVQLTGSTEGEKTITLKGDIQANSVDISGTGKFTFGSDASGGTLEATSITVGVNTDFNAGVTVVSSLIVGDSVTLNVGESGSLHMDDGASITVGNGASLVIATDKLSHDGDVLQINYNGDGGGSGGVEIKLGGNKRITGISGGKGVKLKLNNTASWAYFQNITALEEVVVAGAQVILEGTNQLAGVTDNGANLPSDLVIESGSVTTLTGNLNLSATALDVRDGQLVMENGTINVAGGLYSNAQHSQAGGYVKGIDLVTTVAIGTRTYTGAMELSGNLTKKGAGTQELQGGTANKLSVTGTVTVESGALNWGKAGLESSIGTLTVSGGTFKLLGGTLTVNGAISAGGGTVDLGSAAGTLKVTAESTVGTLNLSGANATLDLSGKLTVNALTGGNLTLAGLTMGAGGHLVLGESINSAINLGTITLTGAAELTLSGAAYTGLRFSGTWAEASAGNELTIHLNDQFLASIEGSDGYQLFAESWAGHVTFATGDGSAYEGRVQLDDSGTKVVITALSDAGLVWNTASDDNTWGDGHSNWGENNGPWVSGSDAVFSDASGETVILSGAVEAGNVNVEEGTWTFQAAAEGTNSLTVSDTLTVGNGAGLTVDANATAAKLTLTGAGTAVTFTGNHKVNMGVITLGAGTKLILQGAQTWTGTNNWNNHATGEGEVVFMGMGVQTVGRSNAGGILWAITNNSEDENTSHDLASLRLSTWEGGGENGADVHTTVYITGEMGSGTEHGLANIANIWVDAGNSLVLGCPALGTIEQERHQGATLHLAGDGSNDAYTSGKNADAALMLVGSNGEDNRRDVRWNIEATENTSISVTEEAATPPDKDQQFWTLLGKFYNNGKTVEKKGDKRLVLGESFTTSANAEGGNGSGTWKVSAGTLELAYAAADTMSGWTVELASGTLVTTKDATLKALSGTGTLKVNSGTLTVGTVADATLANLALGQGTAVGNLTVNAGSFSIGSGLTWVSGSTLTLGGSLQAITLSGENWSQTLETALGAAGKLGITLGADFLNGASGKSFALFSGGGVTDFTKYFDVNLDALSSGYENLTFNSNGTLTWGSTEEPPGPSGDGLYWPGSDAGDRDLTLGGTGENEWSGTEGGALDQSWGTGKNVYLKAADGSVTVTVAEGAIMASLHLDGGATYNFTANAAQTVKVTGDMVNNAVGLSVGANVTLSVGGRYTGSGDVTVDGGLLKFAGEGNTVGGNVTVNNATVDSSYTPNIGIFFDGATVIEGEFRLTGDTGLYNSLTLKRGGTVSGTFHVSWEGHLTLGDDLVVGNLARGTASENWNQNGLKRIIDRDESVTDRNVYILFSEEGGHANDLNAMYDAFRAKANGETNRETIGEGVGYGIAGKAEGSNVTLSLEETSETGYDFKIRGGQVTLDGGTSLTVGTADVKKTLELVGAKLVLGTHTLSAGTLIVSGESTISLTMGQQTAGVLSLTGLSFGGDGSLTIQLADFTAGETHDDFLLFGGGNVSSWLTDVSIAKFSFVDSSGTSIDDVTLGTDGILTWRGAGSEEPEGDLYWGEGSDDSDLTWGTEGDNKFHTDLDGTGESVGWKKGANVHFVEGTGDKTVKLADEKIETGDFEATDLGDVNDSKFEFKSNEAGKERELDVRGRMKATKTEINFGKDIKLSVTGGVTLTDSTMGVKGTADITDDLTGTGSTLKADGGGHVTLHGSVAGFSGTLDTGMGGTITLSGADAELRTTVVGSGILEVNSATGVTLTGQLGGGDGTLTVKNSGVGELLITSGDIGADTSLSFGEGAGNIVLGDAGHAVKIGGSKAVDGTGTLVLRNVTLAGEFGKGSASVVVDTADPAQSAVRAVSAETAGGIVDVGGMRIDDLDSITVNAHGLLKGVNGGTYKVSPDRQLTLHFTADNWETEKPAALIEGSEFKIEFSGKGDADAQGLHIEIDDISIAAALRKAAEGAGEATLYLHALEGGTWNAGEMGVVIDWSKVDGLRDIVLSGSEFTSDGLKITGSTRDIYIVMDGEYSDSATSNSPADLTEKLATVVTKEKTLTLNWSGEGTVRNLLGEENSHLVINASDGQGLTVILENAYHKTIHDDRYPGDVTEAKGMDTEFGGTITGGKGVNIVKSGLGTLAVGGDYSVVGDTRIAEGALRLKGTENTLGSLSFAAGEGEKRELQLEGGKTSVGGITTSEGVTGAALKLTGGAELTLTGTSSMADATISSEDNSGMLKLGKGASLTFTEGKGITGTAVEMKEAELDMGATQSVLTSLNGSGTLKSASGGTVTVGGGAFSGTLVGTGGTLVLKDKVTFTLNNATGTGMNVKLGTGASLLVDVGEKTGASGETLVLGNIELGDGSMKVDYGKNGIGPNFVQGNIVSVGSGSLEFHSDGPIANGKVETGFTLGTGDWQDFLDGIKYTGVGNFVKDHVAERGENDKLVLNMTDAKENKFEREIPGAGKNAHAGAQMLWESLRELTLGDALFAVFANPTSDYARLVFALVQDIDNGQTTGLERTLTSVAGASISTLTPALAQDIHRQLTTIRNRMTGMSAEVPTDGYDEFPFWHAWIQAEGGYHKMDADGTEPGFTLHNWGGTVGVDADISRATTMGLAVTAMYGDLKPDAADSATGDLDTVYLSAFARTMRGAWSHTFVLSGGIAEAKLDRTVSYNGGSYRTRGDTDGYVVGALYEVGYTRLANKEGTVALQPIANVELRHTSLRGYTEKGSDAGVDVDDMDMTVLTLGAGARVQAAVGENAFNRSSVLEARLLAKADIGDRSGTATNAIVGHSKRAEVESAEVGAVGIETGVGISIPLGSHSGSIFADASLEWRDNWVSTNATLGYRINF